VTICNLNRRTQVVTKSCQNINVRCKMNESLIIENTLSSPELRGVSPPCAPYQGSVLNTLGNLKRSPDPSPTHAPPNPKSWIRPWEGWVFHTLHVWSCQIWCVSKTHKKVSYFKSQFIAKKPPKNIVVPHCTTVFDGRQIKSGI
jgi:hypothetical protein